MQQIFIKAKALPKNQQFKNKNSQVVSIKQAWTKKEISYNILKPIPKNSQSEGPNITMYRQ